MDTIEFWLGVKLICAIKSSIVPPEDSLINIMKTTYRVDRVTYAVDYAESFSERRVRATVEISLFDQKEVQ